MYYYLVFLTPNVFKGLIIGFPVILRKFGHHFDVFHYFSFIDLAFGNLLSLSKSQFEACLPYTVAFRFFLYLFSLLAFVEHHA